MWLILVILALVLVLIAAIKIIAKWPDWYARAVQRTIEDAPRKKKK